MRNNKIYALVLSATMVATLVAGCGGRPTSNSESGSTSQSESTSSSQQDEIVLSAVDQKQEFVEFLSNRRKPASQPDGFYANDRTYTVGDDNAFNVKPELTVLNATTFEPVDSSRWTYDFNITATLNGETVGEEYFSVVDAAKADVKFTEAAIDKTFTISVVPTHIDESKVASFTKTFEVTVVDGYNIYDAKELGYFDTRAADSTEEENEAAIEAGFINKWPEFKTQNGLDPTIQPAALIMHKDLKITKDDIPSVFCYTPAEAAALSDDRAANTLKDWVYIYKHTTNSHVTFNGNYFGLDISEMPLITRESHKPTAVGAVVSHSGLFRTNDGSADFLNLKVTGNAPRAEKDEDKVYGGGLIFMKSTKRSTNVKLDNMIARDLFITVFTECPEDLDRPVMAVQFSKAKCSNNYNSFLYNWGAKFVARDSSFSNCGGPIVIQDHTAPSDKYEDENGRVVNGYAPESNFINCELNNFVAGSEAWFQQFNVTTLIPQIKALSDLYYVSGIGKGFVVDQNHNATIYQQASAAQAATFFNFVVINKSGSNQGATASQVCGKVNIINETTSTADYFDYRQPAYDEVFLAYAAYVADPTDANQQALIATAMAHGVEFAADFSDANEKITEYITNICTLHEVLRGLNSGGAPVFDFGHGLPLGTTDGSSMYEATSFAAYMQGAIPAPTAYSLSAEQKAQIGDYTTVYYNGMALVFALYSF